MSHLTLLGVIVAASVMGAFNDCAIGIHLEQYPKWKQIIHKLTYMAFGGIIAKIML
ncbi:MAG: hypothetical protein UT22_C0007G0020 [Parcubacteria group bacterium GW2011_GWC2_39_11]|nr:MAG: hypothetical protein US88_C0005G0031 [Parcubacteria group bacterium GW2011_GWA2_38_27]KKQ97834.1 MAG: hypothetical protein UT22_C0007G0020 [Parcubacteria group bacterium GW2011_GWC2_39_11]